MMSDYKHIINTVLSTLLHYDVVKLKYASIVSIHGWQTISDVFPTDRSTTLDHQPSLGNQYTTLPDERFLSVLQMPQVIQSRIDSVTRNARLLSSSQIVNDSNGKQYTTCYGNPASIGRCNYSHRIVLMSGPSHALPLHPPRYSLIT